MDAEVWLDAALSKLDASLTMMAHSDGDDFFDALTSVNRVTEALLSKGHQQDARQIWRGHSGKWQEQ